MITQTFKMNWYWGRYLYMHFLGNAFPCVTFIEELNTVTIPTNNNYLTFISLIKLKHKTPSTSFPLVSNIRWSAGTHHVCRLPCQLAGKYFSHKFIKFSQAFSLNTDLVSAESEFLWQMVIQNIIWTDNFLQVIVEN